METKKEFRWFTIFQYEQEQEYLRRQHNAGWKFCQVTGLGMYHFERCQPEDVVYQLDYNQEGSAHKDQYIQMYAGYSYFRKAAAKMDGDEEIFCDDESKLAMMERVLRGRMLPLLIFFSACLMPQFVINLANGRTVAAALMGGVLALYASIFATCAVKYNHMKNGRNSK